MVQNVKPTIISEGMTYKKRLEEEIAALTPQLTRHAKKLMNRYCKSDIEDLVQETIYTALKNIDKYNEKGKLSAWLYKIMRNIYLNDICHKQRVPNATEFIYSDIQTNDPTDGLCSIQLLEQLISCLDKKKRDIVIARLTGYSYKEIAEMYNIPLGTVKSRLHKAKALLESMI